MSYFHSPTGLHDIALNLRTENTFPLSPLSRVPLNPSALSAEHCLPNVNMTYYGVPRTTNILHTRAHITISREYVKKIESCALFGLWIKGKLKCMWLMSSYIWLLGLPNSILHNIHMSTSSFLVLSQLIICFLCIWGCSLKKATILHHVKGQLL